MIQEIIFDCETKNLFSDVGSTDPGKLGVSIVSAYIRQVTDYQSEIHGQMRSFWEPDFPELFKLMKASQRIIGFNSIKFDVPALIPYDSPQLTKLPHFDIILAVRDALGHFLSLDTLAKHTLGKEKIDVGTNAVLYWKSHDPENLAKLQKYCEMDVLLTKELYDYGVRNKKLLYKDRNNVNQQFAVDFSYPEDIINASRQIGLF